MSIFGTRMAAVRTSKGITQASLATTTGLQPAAVSRVEAGRFSPSLGNAIKIADGLDVSLDYLTGRSDGDAEMQRRAAVLAQIEELKAQL